MNDQSEGIRKGLPETNWRCLICGTHFSGNSCPNHPQENLKYDDLVTAMMNTRPDLAPCDDLLNWTEKHRNQLYAEEIQTALSIHVLQLARKSEGPV